MEGLASNAELEVRFVWFLFLILLLIVMMCIYYDCL